MQLVKVRAGEGGGSGWSWEWRPSGGLSEPTFNGSVCAGLSEGASAEWVGGPNWVEGVEVEDGEWVWG